MSLYGKKTVFHGVKPVFHASCALDQNPGIANLANVVSNNNLQLIITGAKPLPVDFGHRLPPKPVPVSSPSAMMSSAQTGPPALSSSPSVPRPPLPVDSEGKLDLNRLQLPQGRIFSCNKLLKLFYFCSIA